MVAANSARSSASENRFFAMCLRGILKLSSGASFVHDEGVLQQVGIAGVVGDNMRHSCYGSCCQMGSNFVLYSLPFAYAEVVEFAVACFTAGKSVVVRRQECYRKRYVQVRTKCVKPSVEIATWIGSVDVHINRRRRPLDEARHICEPRDVQSRDALYGIGADLVMVRKVVAQGERDWKVVFRCSGMSINTTVISQDRGLEVVK